MFRQVQFLLIFMCLILSHSANAALTGLTEDDMKYISKLFSTRYSHSSASSASTLGEFFGFEIGAVGGRSDSPSSPSTVFDVSPFSDLRKLPVGVIYLGFSIPMALKLEIEVAPKMTYHDVEFQKASFAVQWTLTDTILPLPFDFALKYHFGVSGASITETVLGTTETVDIANKTIGFDFVFSKSYMLLEPYIAVGVIQSYITVGTDGAIPIFSFTTDTGAASGIRGYEYLVGVAGQYGHYRAGLEIGSVYDSMRSLARLSAGF